MICPIFHKCLRLRSFLWVYFFISSPSLHKPEFLFSCSNDTLGPPPPPRPHTAMGNASFLKKSLTKRTPMTYGLRTSDDEEKKGDNNLGAIALSGPVLTEKGDSSIPRTQMSQSEVAILRNHPKEDLIPAIHTRHSVSRKLPQVSQCHQDLYALRKSEEISWNCQESVFNRLLK